MGQLARGLATHRDLETTLTGITTAVVAAVPGADYAGITRASGRDQVSAQAPTHGIVGTLDALQAELRQGPCVAALREQRTISVPDMTTETRWPEFAAAAVQHGVGSMLSLQLFLDDGTLGALNLYATTPAAFTADDQTIAEVFATHAAIALHGAAEQQRLIEAVASRDVIGQAKGILMNRHHSSAEEAFEQLVAASQQGNIKLVDVARQLVDNPDRPLPPRRAHAPQKTATSAASDTNAGRLTVRAAGAANTGPNIVELSGEIDAATEPALHKQLTALPNRDTVVGLAGVTFLSAGGLNLLQELSTQLDATGARLCLAGPSPTIRRLISLVGLAETLPCRPTRAQAVQALPQQPASTATSRVGEEAGYRS